MATRFDAAADRLLRTSILSYNAAYAVCFWVYVTATTGTFQIPYMGNSGSTADGDWFEIASNGLSIYGVQNIASAQTTTASQTIALGTWYHLAIVRESTTILKFYVNGVLLGTLTDSVSARSAGTRMEAGAVTTTNQFRLEGRIAAFKIWNALLTIDQVLNEMRSFRPKKLTNQWLIWPCRNLSDNKDETGNARSATVGGTLTTEDNPPISWN